MRDEFEVLRDILEAGRGAVLVVVVQAAGSAPRGAGAMMLVDKDGWAAGSVGGGAIELRAVEEARKVLRAGKSSTRNFVLNPNDASQLGMVCGGEVRMLYVYLPPDEASRRLAQSAADCRKGEQAAWLLFAYGGQQGSAWGKAELYAPGAALLQAHPLPAGRQEKMLLQNEPVLLENGDAGWLGVPLLQPGRVLVFGGGHLGQALVPLLIGLSFHCVVFDERPEFAQAALFPGARQVLVGEFCDFERYIEVKPDDYAVVVTRGHAADYTVLERLLRRKTAYTGVVGSRTKTKAVNEKLLAAGVPQSALDTVYTPIGLSIGAKTPAEIAVSIAAQLIQVRAGRRG